MDEPTVKPDPHWRAILRSTDFYRDILVTILGVLIALGIGELVQAADWRSRAEAATRAIDAELTSNAATFEERVLLQPCLEKRMAELEAVYAGARSTHRLPSVGKFGATPYRGLETAAWDDAVNNGVLAHMEPRQKTRLATVYPTIENYNAFVMNEQTLWYRMQLMQNAEGPVSDAMLTEIGATLKELTYRVRLNSLLAEQLLTFTTRRGLTPDRSVFGNAATRETLAADVAARPICRPLAIS